MITLSSYFNWPSLAFVQRASRNDADLDVAAAMRRARQALEDRGAKVTANSTTGVIEFAGAAPGLGFVSFGTIGSGELRIERSGDTITATADSSLWPALLLTAASLGVFLARHVPFLLLTIPLAFTAWGIWLNDVIAVRRLVQAALSLNNPTSDLEET